METARGEKREAQYIRNAGIWENPAQDAVRTHNFLSRSLSLLPRSHSLHAFLEHSSHPPPRYRLETTASTSFMSSESSKAYILDLGDVRGDGNASFLLYCPKGFVCLLPPGLDDHSPAGLDYA